MSSSKRMRPSGPLNGELALPDHVAAQMARQQAQNRSLRVDNIRQIALQHNFVLVRKLGRGETPGGIVLPDTDAPNAVWYGEVIAVGPGRYSEVFNWRPPMSVAVGDIVVLMIDSVQPPVEIDCGGERFLIFRDRDMIGTVLPTAEIQVNPDAASHPDQEQPATADL